MADAFDGMDVSAGGGGAIGTIAEQHSDGSIQKFKIGGFPVVAILNRDLGEKWSGHLEVQLMLTNVDLAVCSKLRGRPPEHQGDPIT